MAAGGAGSSLVKWGGVCGILGATLGIVLILAATVMEPTFRWDESALSELGVASVAPVFNGAVIIGGLPTILFGLGVRAWLPRRLLTDLGSGILVVGGVSLALVGVFTLDYPGLHGAVALGYFLLVPVGMLLLAFVFGDMRWRRRRGTFSAGVLLPFVANSPGRFARAVEKTTHVSVT